MAETDTEILANGTGALSEEDERMKQRPADIDADVREMERRKRVEALMSSKLFREELERVLDQQMHEGADAPLLQRIKEMVGGRLHTGSFRGPSCVLPINDIRGIEGVGYEKGEKILRCKLAALYRLVDLFGWTQCGVASQLTARLNTAVEQLLISPRGLMPHEVTASSLLKVDMQGTVIDSGTTNYGVHKSGFSVHAAVHAARPDVRCVLHLRSPPVLAISATKTGLLPLCTEAALIGDVAYHRVPTGILDNEERDKIVRVLGPSCKILFLRSQGALCCGSTLEEAFYHAKHLHTAADVQLKLATVPRDQLAVMDDEERKEVYDAARAEGAAESNKWRAGGEEFEALMRMLDNAGFRTGYIYRNPLVKNDVPRPKNDVEVPPAVSSLGYLLEEEEMYRQGLWKKGQGKTGERTRWLNSPNVYQKVEVLETGTNDPKKITKWVDANNEEWVQDGSPAHSSTPMKIDAALQFVPKNTNPKEFKALQQQIKDNRRADKISAGPQSHILEGVTWDEANRLNAEDASATHAGDHVVLVGAASKGIIQRGYQHNATVYSAPYARNPFEHVSERDLDEYTRRVTGQNNYDTDLSESEAISAAQMTSPISETEEESRDEHRVLRIETKTAPMRSQPEVVLSDDATDFLNAERSHVDRTRGVGQNPKLTQSPKPSTANKKRDYPRCPNFESLILRYETPKNDPKCKVNLKKRYHSEPTNAYAVELCNPVYLGSRGSLNSVPSIEWDVKKADYNFRSQSLPRKLGRKDQQQRYYRSCSHAGFINTFLKNPEPVHYHMPKCRKCGSFNSSYDWEITKRDLKSLGQSSIWHSYENIHKSCLREGDKKVLAICDVVRVKEMDAPVFDINKEFIDSEEYNEDCYLENTYLSNSTVVEIRNLDRTLVEAEANNVNTDIHLDSSYKAFDIVTDTNIIVKIADDIAVVDNDECVDHVTIKQEVLSENGVDENGIYRAECVYIETSGENSKSDSRKSSNNSPQSNKENTDGDTLISQEISEVFAVDSVKDQVLGVDVISQVVKSTENDTRIYKALDNSEIIENEARVCVDSSVYRVFRTVLKEFKSKLYHVDAFPETEVDFTVDNMEGEYLNFTNELDFDRAVYDSPVKNLITKDVRDFLVPLDFYNDVKESPSKFNKSVGNVLETIAEETKVSDSSNDSVKDSSGEKQPDQNSFHDKIAPEIPTSKEENIISDDINKKSSEDERESDIENGINNVEICKVEPKTEIPIRQSSVVDLSSLEICENFKISIESSSNEAPSFDSTAEFEKIEVVADVIGVLIKRVSITIVNKDENDFYKTVDVALKTKHKGVKFFDMDEAEECNSNKAQAGIDVQKEGFNQKPDVLIESEHTSSESNEYAINEQSVILKNDSENIFCENELFSIVQIVESIDQEVVEDCFTVLSEDSDLDPKSHPFKVCESIVYHILCTVYCKIKQKSKPDNRNGKAVVTVVDVEDIMGTALPIWDLILGDQVVTVSNDEENDDFKLPVKARISEPYVYSDCLDPSEVIAKAEPIKDILLVSSNGNVGTLQKKYVPDLQIVPKDATSQIALGDEDALEPTEPLVFNENVRDVFIKDEDNTYALINDIVITVFDNAVIEDDCIVLHAQVEARLETSSQVSKLTTTTPERNSYVCEFIGIVAAKENVSSNKDDLKIEATITSNYSSENICVKELDNKALTEKLDACPIETKDDIESNSNTKIGGDENKETYDLEELLVHCGDIQTEKLTKTLDFRGDDDTHSEQEISPEEPISSDSRKPAIDSHDHDIKVSKLIAKEQINRIVSNIIDDQIYNATIPTCHTAIIDHKPEDAPKKEKLIAEDTPKFEGDYATSSSSHTALVGNEQEDAIEDSKLIVDKEVNRIISNIHDCAGNFEGGYATNPDILSVDNEHKDAIKESKLIAAEEIARVILNIPDCTRECDQDSELNINSNLPLNDTVADLNSMEPPFSNLNPDAAPFFMKHFQAQDSTNEENDNTDINISSHETVKLDVNDILDEVLEVVSSIYDRYSNDNTYSVSPVHSNESIEGIYDDERVGLIRETSEIAAIDVSKSFEESRKLSHSHNREEANIYSPDDDHIVLDVYDTKSYGKHEKHQYVTELKSAIQGYHSEYDEYNDSLNESNEYNEEIYIEKNDTPKFVDLVTRDEDGSIDSITYNSHILQTIVENLLQDVISEFVIDDNVSEIINTEVSQNGGDNLKDVKINLVKRSHGSSSFVKIDAAKRSTDLAVIKNETFVLDSKDSRKIENRNTSEVLSFRDMAYESGSKTDLDHTYVLDTELGKDNSELTEVSYFDTAFCEDTMLTNQSSPYKNNSPVFSSCDESPIKNPNTAYINDSVLYDKCDISPFDKTSAVLSMSQSVNSGGVKYWLSFDDSFTDIDDKVKANRGKKSRDIPTFYSFDTVDNLPARGSSNNSNVFKIKASDSSIYVTATSSKTENDDWTSYNPEPSTSKEQNEGRLIFDCSKRRKKFDCSDRSNKRGRREYHTWPPYDESLFYRIISNFRMTESFDLSDLDNVEHR